MSKVLMYVDAENVSRNQVDLMLKKVKADHQEDDEFIGKFYGARSSLSSSIQYFLNLGFEFIETGVLSQSKKNLADMKMTVDSLFDVLKTYQGDVRTLYLLSNDSDFNPVIYKLSSLGIPVIASAFETFDEIREPGDLARYLYVKHIYPIKPGNAVSIFYDVIKFATKDVRVSEAVILEYLRSRYERLRRFVCSKYRITYFDLSIDEIKNYSFYAFHNWLKMYGAEDMLENFRTYTQKVFGSEIPKAVCLSVLNKR